MYDRTQLMKGTLEGCILKIIGLQTTYGYEIVSQLAGYGFAEVSEGTVYPLLVRLEKKGMITSVFRPSELGPSRKYYSLTDEGQRLLAEFADCWRETARTVGRILALEERGENAE